MNETDRRSKPISASDLPRVLEVAFSEGWTELVLVGPIVHPDSPYALDRVKEKTSVFRLIECVDDLHQRLQALQQLTCLLLPGNQIGDEGARAVAQLSNLTNLDLGWNQIGDEGAKAVAQLPNLTNLNLRDNQIGDEGAKALAQLSNLTNLDLGWNQIGDEGAKAVAQLSTLTDLNLSSNQIGEEGARAVAQLPNLTNLNLRSNQIGDEAARAVAQLSNLTFLYLSDNQITDDGVAAVTQLSNLSHLDLSNNQVGEQGARAVAQLAKLTDLNLGNNQIGDEGARAVAQLSNLTFLYLSDNQITDDGVAALAQLSNLSHLDLSNNQVGDQGARAVAQLAKLTDLNLDGNRIGDEGVRAFASHGTLSSLRLAKSHVESVHAFASLPRLRHLELTRTKVSDLSPLSSLMKRGVPVYWNRSWSGHDGIFVKGCPLTHPSPEVVQQGRDAVLNYFREIESQGVDRLFEAKVLILGEGGSGKTSLLRRLYDKNQPLPREDETTRGIDIHEHRFAMAGGGPFRLNVWDFGGQQIYHATHQFFLTKSSLYVLVDDTRKDNKTIHDEGFKYWLEVIETLSDRSPILVFQNEKGGRSKAIDEAGIKGRFPNVKEVYGGNLEQADAAEDLSKAIELFVQQLPHVGEEVPAKWLDVRRSIEEAAHTTPYISRRDYFDIYNGHLDADRTKALHLSRDLHDLGVFLHFQDDHRLNRTIILQNRWPTEAVFRVLDDEFVKRNRGRYTGEDCERLWASSEYAEMHPELLALMEKFELCYRLTDGKEETWLAPQLLSPSMPPEMESWPAPGDLVLSYRYDFLPKGLINRLMVRMQRFVHRPEMAWGAVCSSSETPPSCWHMNHRRGARSNCGREGLSEGHS